jgi:hypothetical protein
MSEEVRSGYRKQGRRSQCRETFGPITCGPANSVPMEQFRSKLCNRFKSSGLPRQNVRSAK